MIHNRRNQWLLKCSLVAAGLMTYSLTLAAQKPPAPRPGAKSQSAPAKRPATVPAAAQPKFKGIWEPVNYPEDIEFISAYFVSGDEGWVSGGVGNNYTKGGVILHTADGGDHWDVQYGDPQSADSAPQQLRFLSPRQGWALGPDHSLLHTRDGKHWILAGTVPYRNNFDDYRFTSETHGVGQSEGSISITNDGGKTWKEVFACRTKVQVNGLTRDSDCSFRRLQFVTSTLGYAIGGAYEDDKTMVLAKTTDGGATWSLTVSPGNGSPWDCFFIDEQLGFEAENDSGNYHLYQTTDGGVTWNGIPAAPGLHLKLQFADPEVGWTLPDGRTMTFTTDGGSRWTSRAFAFPEYVEAFSLPRRDRAYVVGKHGMVYRYRIVPVEYTAKGMIDGPPMPAYGGQMNTDLDNMKVQVKALQDKLASAAAVQRPVLQSVAFRVPSRGPAQAQQNPAGGAGFTQDTMDAPMSPAMQSCCTTEIQGLQTNVGSFSQQAPLFAGKFRNLNVLFVGMNMLADLMGRAQAMRGSFVALKKAPDRQAAAVALQNFSGQLQGTSQTVSAGFPNLFAGGTAQGAAGTVSTAVGSGIPTAPGSTSGAAANPDPNAAPAAQPAPQDPKKKDSTVDELKKKAKKIPIPWPH
jgi:photosystem II stability/assembly factor-like uncharacterized protein